MLKKSLQGIEGADSLPHPNVKTDGLLPFIISRLKNNQDAIIKADHQIRFAIARGPLNIASFLMGTTELMMATAMDPEGTHRLLKKIPILFVIGSHGRKSASLQLMEFLFLMI